MPPYEVAMGEARHDGNPSLAVRAASMAENWITFRIQAVARRRPRILHPE